MFSHLHMQMVVKLHISNLKMLNKVLKERLGEMVKEKHQMSMSCTTSKQLQDTSFYTFNGMVGYCMKNIDENHFQIVHHNVNGEMIKVGMLEFVNYKATTMKN